MIDFIPNKVNSEFAWDFNLDGISRNREKSKRCTCGPHDGRRHLNVLIEGLLVYGGLVLLEGLLFNGSLVLLDGLLVCGGLVLRSPGWWRSRFGKRCPALWGSRFVRSAGSFMEVLSHEIPALIVLIT